MKNSEDDKAFSSIDFVGQCLVDEERTLAFQKAISETVKPGASVLDLGTGSGILAIMAAKAGAVRVTAVEYDPFVASIASSIVKANGYEDIISIIVSDARTLELPSGTRFDVVLAELLTTGMVDECQVEAINNLHARGYVDKDTTFVPERQDTFAALTHADFSMYGLVVPMTLHLWKWHDWKSLECTARTNTVLLNSMKSDHLNDENFDTIVEFQATESGEINSLYLTSISVLFDNIHVADTEALNSPMLIPISPRTVSAGETIRLHISYTFGGGYNTLEYKYL